ncbi:MAG: Cof-type HAD-IIB family hydrolase [Clostridia bacterium]|nr:Cof-type HAD-IIB family hydrolase [Clostridia bacterium]
MGAYDGIYLFADMDGTLLNDQKTIPEVNLRALEKFTAEGGMFGMATGRSPHNLSFFPEVLPLTAPSILDNGGVLYDVKNREYMECTYIPREKSIGLVNRIIEIDPASSVQVYTCSARYQVNLDPQRIDDPLVALEGIYEPLCRAEDIREEWIKIVLCLPEEQLKVMLDTLDLNEIRKDYSTVHSGRIYFEFLCHGMTKGNGIAALRKNGNNVKKILAIGDYYNDAEMLRIADVSAAPVNAEEDIKAMVNYVTCDNNQGAVADFLHMALGMEI